MRRLKLLCSALFALAASAPLAAQEAGGESDLAAFEACARIADAGERHVCLDEALRAAGMLDAEAPAQAVDGRAPASQSPPAAPAGLRRADLASPPAEPVGTDVAPPPPPPPARRERASSEPHREPYHTSIVAARLIGSHTLQVTTNDAGSWVSTERQSFRRTPEPGDSFEIVPAALGGYRCRLERTTIYPCRRVE